MHDKSGRLRWSVEQRFEFIEFRLYWEGGLNRSDLVNYFGISVPQASNDLRRYQQIAPKNLRYDTSLKRYFASSEFSPQFLVPDATKFLTELNSIARETTDEDETWIAHLPSFAAVAVPRRIIDTGYFKSVLTAIRAQQTLEIRYQSLSSPAPQWRTISPHAFAFDGMRWHTRAFCHMRQNFRDFLLSRVLGTRATYLDVAGEEDELWNNEIEIVLEPHPKCTEGQKKAIELDYGMTRGQTSVKMRHAMLFYFLKRQGFLDDGKRVASGREKPEQQQHVVLADAEAVQAHLDETKTS